MKIDLIVCPNGACQKLVIDATLYSAELNAHYGWQAVGDPIKSWRLQPESTAKPLPPYIPEAIVTEYTEACRIFDLSPKASATLSRRCLQGMIRDFWSVKPARLIDEIKAIEDRVDPLTWEAIDSVRKVGNVGAHMEKDINVIVDVEAGEAELLIELIETLSSEWYVNREERKVRMEAVVSAAANVTPDHPTPQAQEHHSTPSP